MGRSYLGPSDHSSAKRKPESHGREGGAPDGSPSRAVGLNSTGPVLAAEGPVRCEMTNGGLFLVENRKDTGCRLGGV